MGFNWIFVNPIQRPGMSGSIYAIADYFELNPALVDANIDKKPEQQVREMIECGEKLGLKMIVDLVINHCSVDSPLLKQHPEWFEWDDKGKVVHPFATEKDQKVVWKDLARFNYRNTKDQEGLYQYFFRIVQYLIDLGFRGFRCDAAYQIPPQLWQRLIQQSKEKNPDVVFLAETLGCRPKETKSTASAGFNYIFNSSKWWDYKSRWLLSQYNLTRDVVPSIGFPESHDTLRLCEELNGNLEGVKQRYLFTALFSAGVMIPMGFEFGFRKKPHVVKTTPGDWENTGIDLSSFIAKVNKIKENYSIFQEEVPTQIFVEDNPQVLILWKGSSRTNQEALVLLNKDIHNWQLFKTDNIYDFIESKFPLMDVSPENPMEEIPAYFAYNLPPGQGRVLVAQEKS